MKMTTDEIRTQAQNNQRHPQQSIERLISFKLSVLDDFLFFSVDGETMVHHFKQKNVFRNF